jgi:hypothetical protein
MYPVGTRDDQRCVIFTRVKRFDQIRSRRADEPYLAAIGRRVGGIGTWRGGKNPSENNWEPRHLDARSTPNQCRTLGRSNGRKMR